MYKATFSDGDSYLVFDALGLKAMNLNFFEHCKQDDITTTSYEVQTKYFDKIWF